MRAKANTPRRGCALPIAPGFLHLARDEKHCQQLAHRIAPPFVREVLASFRSHQLSATSAAAELGIGRTRFSELYADYLRACSRRQAARWLPGVSGGDHAASWPPEVEPLLRKLPSSRPPSGYSSAASEIKRRLDFQLDPATVRRFALANGLAPKKPAAKPRAAVRRWQCRKIGALWQLDATPHRWWPEGPLLPLLNMLDDCSRRRVGARIYAAENLPAYLDFLPRAFLEHGLPLRLYVDCHSFFLSSVPDALTQLGTALHFYDITFRYAPTPQAKGKIERRHQDWQNRIPALLAADAASAPPSPSPPTVASPQAPSASKSPPRREPASSTASIQAPTSPSSALTQSTAPCPLSSFTSQLPDPLSAFARNQLSAFACSATLSSLALAS